MTWVGRYNGELGSWHAAECWNPWPAELLYFPQVDAGHQPPTIKLEAKNSSKKIWVFLQWKDSNDCQLARIAERNRTLTTLLNHIFCFQPIPIPTLISTAHPIMWCWWMSCDNSCTVSASHLFGCLFLPDWQMVYFVQGDTVAFDCLDLLVFFVFFCIGNVVLMLRDCGGAVAVVGKFKSYSCSLDL